MDRADDILDISRRASARAPFALAIVVRTAAATAAKAGAKAVILPDGTISGSWIGGGCARTAVLKAARDALADGKSRLVAVQPQICSKANALRPATSRWHALRPEHVPEPGHHGHFRRADFPAPAGGDK